MATSNNKTGGTGPTAAGGMHMLARGAGTSTGIAAGYAGLAAGDVGTGTTSPRPESHAVSASGSPARPTGASPVKRSPRPGTKSSPAASPRVASTERTAEVQVTKPATFSGPLQPHTYRAVSKGPAPGPGAYDPHAGIGKQTVSTKPSQPAFGFGTAPKLPEVKPTVGEHYISHESPGKARLSSHRAQPAFSFGSSPRDKPLPGHKKATDVPFLDATKVSTIGETAKYSFSKSPRLEDTGRRSVTQAVAYDSHEHVTAVKSVVSTKPNAPAIGFGSAPQRASLSPRKEGKDATVLSQDLASSIGRMVDSRKSTVPAHSFGSSARMTTSEKSHLTKNVDFTSHATGAVGAPSPVKSNVPSFGFGTSTRDTAAKTGILAAHSS